MFMIIEKNFWPDRISGWMEMDGKEKILLKKKFWLRMWTIVEDPFLNIKENSLSKVREKVIKHLLG